MKGLTALQAAEEGPTRLFLMSMISSNKAPSVALGPEGKKLVKPVYF